MEYSLKLDGPEPISFKTQVVEEQTRNPAFEYKMTHSYNNINDEILNYLQTTNVSYLLFSSYLESSELNF